jgi:hypothetical protein
MKYKFVIVEYKKGVLKECVCCQKEKLCDKIGEYYSCEDCYDICVICEFYDGSCIINDHAFCEKCMNEFFY